MRKLLWIILGIIAVGAIYTNLDFSDLSLSMPTEATELEDYNQGLVFMSENTETSESSQNGSYRLAEEEDYLYLDTMMTVDGKAIAWGGYEIPLNLMFDGEVISDNPLVKMDSVSPSVCKLDMKTRQEDFDLTDKDIVSRFQQFNKPLDGFTRFHKEYVEHFDSVVTEDNVLLRQNTMYSFTVDYPNEEFLQREDLLKWLCYMISIAQNMDVEVPTYTAQYIGYNRSKYKGQIYSGNVSDMAQLGAFISKKAFSEWEPYSESLFDIRIVTDYRAHIVNNKYVTYGAFVHSNQEPGHGMYTETFYTYDLNSKTMVNNSSLFEKGSMEKVKEILFEEMAKDKSYRPFNKNVETAEDVEKIICQWNTDKFTGTQKEFVMPQGALTNEGVIFSFQPYQIDCYASGAFHFIVPYDRLKPYLTERAKKLF